MRSKIYICYLTFFLNSVYVFGQNTETNFLFRCNDKLINVIMEDLFTPPVASRIHVYPNIAAYQVLCKANGSLNRLDGQLKDLQKLPDPTEIIDYSLSACAAFTAVAKKLVYSEYMLTDFENTENNKWLSSHQNDTVLLNHSIEYGKIAAQKIIIWLKKDNYDYTRTLSRYTLADSAGAWQPTGPEYANAIEPNWPLIRSLVFDSSHRIKCLPNLPYSEDKKSLYYKKAFAVYKQSQTLDSVKKSIAAFWDCNPNIVKSGGHLTYFVHKISPAGHWIGIAGHAVNTLKLDIYKTAEVYTLLTLGIFEGLKECWSAKYLSNAVRPETYINRVISPTWKTYIETPPFPEYPSGHSVISGVSAAVLTSLIPQPFEYTDSTEMYINLPPRHFTSFKAAAAEASVSRFYGGIHYMLALDNGLSFGNEIGNFIYTKLKSQKL